MKRTLISVDFGEYPTLFHPYFRGAQVYDSSSSLEARVIFLDKDEGFYLKISAAGTLATEAEMTRFYASKGLSAGVVEYYTADGYDYLLTPRVLGEDCTSAQYLNDPKRLADTLGTLLRELHDTDFTGCPVPNRLETYLETVKKNYREGRYDLSYRTPEIEGFSGGEIYRFVFDNAYLLKNDTLIHGDYCLPNVMLNDWRFSGFIDLGNGGVGDRHIDLFWGAWTLRRNLKTDEYRSRFFDAYGRDRVMEHWLPVIAAAEIYG